jgi:hypothetical protein
MLCWQWQTVPSLKSPCGNLGYESLKNIRDHSYGEKCAVVQLASSSGCCSQLNMWQSGLQVRSELLEIWTSFARPVDAENTCACNSLMCVLTVNWATSSASVIVIRLLGEFFCLVAKTGHGPHSSQINCVVLCIVCVYMCTVLLPLGVNPTADNRYIYI